MDAPPNKPSPAVILQRFHQKHPPYAALPRNSVAGHPGDFILVSYREDDAILHLIVSADGDILAATRDFYSIYSRNGLLLYMEKTGTQPGGNLAPEGIVDEQFNIVAPAIFDEIRLFENKYLLVRIKNNYGLLNRAGREILPVRYGDIFLEVQNGRFYAQAGDRYEMRDVNGRLIDTICYPKLLLIQANGKTLLKAIAGRDNFEPEEDKQNQVAGKTGLLDLDGRILIPAEYELLKTGVYVVLMKSEQLQYDAGNPFGWHAADPYYTVTGGKWGVTDYDHTVLVPFEYEYIRALHKEGLYLANKGGRPFYSRGHRDDAEWGIKGGKWGLVNVQHETLVPVIYERCEIHQDKILFQQGYGELMDKTRPYVTYSF